MTLAADPSNPTDKEALRVCVVSAHTAVGEMLASTLRSHGAHVVRPTGTDPVAVRAAGHGCHAFVICTWGMPRRGRHVTRFLTAVDPGTRIVIVDDATHDEDASDLVRCGATAIVGRDVDLATAMNVVVSACRGDSTLRTTATPSTPVGVQQDAAVLSVRETEILQLVVDGLTVPDMARQLFISTKTVKHHLSAVYAKLGSTNRTEAVVRGLRLGLVDLTDA